MSFPYLSCVLHRKLHDVSKISTKAFFSVFIICIFLQLNCIEARRHRYQAGQESRQVVCYGYLGCFNILPPFSPAMPLPMSPRKIQTKYFLRTRQNLNIDQPILPEASNLTASLFDPSRRTKIIIHGFVMKRDSHLAHWVPEVTETILFHEDVNVIQINWIKGAAVEYDYAASNTRIVGAQVGYLIKMLMEVHNARAKDFHLIGFSLGAHVAGFAAKKVQEGRKENIIGRITGLDPANPGFNYDSTVVRLDKSDAKFVDIIHTDTSTVLVMASGMNRNLGHVDFYPNGGAEQPGCHSWSKDSSWISAVTDRTVCDHLRAPELFKHSINATGDNNPMVGYKCGNYEQFKRGVCLQCRGKNYCRRMGYWAEPLSNNKKQLQFYLKTSDNHPYTVNHYQIQIHWRTSADATKEGFKAKLFIALHGDQGSTPEMSLNDGTTFHIHTGRTTRFLFTQDTNQDIGNLESVSFRWERPTCWTYFFCPNENVKLKRIKVLDASKQERSVFLPLGRNQNQKIKSHFVKPGEHFELLRTSFIRSKYPRRYKSLDKEESHLKQSKRYVIHPSLISVHGEEVSTPSPSTLQNEQMDLGVNLSNSTSIFFYVENSTRV